jgi:hypothetical protein
MNLLVITLHLRWSTMAVAIGAIIATGTGATMIAVITVAQNTMTRAMADAEIESHEGGSGTQGPPPSFATAPLRSPIQEPMIADASTA